jgi:hypothetical protein
MSSFTFDRPVALVLDRVDPSRARAVAPVALAAAVRPPAARRRLPLVAALAALARAFVVPPVLAAPLLVAPLPPVPAVLLCLLDPLLVTTVCLLARCRLYGAGGAR